MSCPNVALGEVVLLETHLYDTQLYISIVCHGAKKMAQKYYCTVLKHQPVRSLA